jgi:ABC-2 type transport system permease protein
MYTVFRKEINSFFSSLVGYIAIILFLIICGLFMWVMPDTNLMDYGYASMDKYFQFVPWIILFLIPAITMRSFADEFKSGTIELLSTKPLKENNLIAGKFLASFFLVLFSILATMIYVFSMSKLSKIAGNLDTGSIIGSYIGLFFLVAAFTAVGIFCSSLTDNQVIAFLLAISINFVLYLGIESLSKLPVFSKGTDYIISQLGMQSHYTSISRGVLDTRDLIYFISVSVVFLYATKISLLKRKN